MFDETPNDDMKLPKTAAATYHSDAVYNSHFGQVSASSENEKEQVDTSQYR